MLYATLALQMGNPLSEESVFSSTVWRPFGRSFEEITFKLIVGHRKTCRKFLLLFSKKMKEKKHCQLNRSFSGVKNLFTNCSRDCFTPFHYVRNDEQVLTTDVFFHSERSASDVKNLFIVRDSSFVGMTFMFVILIGALAKWRIYLQITSLHFISFAMTN